MNLDRRQFVALTAGALGAALVTGCASHAVSTIEPVDGEVHLALARFPQLSRPGGWVKIRPAGSASVIYVLALEPDGIAALSPICTHLGCTVGVEGPVLVCPCHGSTYDREGRVLRGPAERALRSFPVTRTPTEIVLQLNGPA